MARFRKEHAVNGRWSRWVQPIRRGYKLACCDCGLVHDIDFRIVKRNSNGAKFIQFRVARNERSTALSRRYDGNYIMSKKPAKPSKPKPGKGGKC